jgi:hypothetical protein
MTTLPGVLWYPLTARILRRAVKHLLISLKELAQSHRPTLSKTAARNFETDSRKASIVLLRIHRHRLADLLQVRGAYDLLRLLLCPNEHWQQNGDQDDNNSNNNKELDQSETESLFPLFHGAPLQMTCACRRAKHFRINTDRT